MAGSVSRQDEAYPKFWLAIQSGKIPLGSLALRSTKKFFVLRTPSLRLKKGSEKYSRRAYRKKRTSFLFYIKTPEENVTILRAHYPGGKKASWS